MENTIYANDIELRGFIVHKYEAPKATIITLSTGKSNDVVNYPKIVLFGNLIEQAKQFDVHDNVTVTANAQSSRKDEGGKQFYVQSLFGETISPTPKALEENFGVDGYKYLPPINTIKISGYVYRITTPAKNMVKLAIGTIKNGRRSIVQVSFFTKKVGEVMEQIRARDNVCGVGMIQTSKRVVKGETRYYETIVLSDLQKVT